MTTVRDPFTGGQVCACGHYYNPAPVHVVVIPGVDPMKHRPEYIPRSARYNPGPRVYGPPKRPIWPLLLAATLAIVGVLLLLITMTAGRSGTTTSPTVTPKPAASPWYQPSEKP